MKGGGGGGDVINRPVLGWAHFAHWALPPYRDVDPTLASCRPCVACRNPLP